jgi:7-cyano-7-deazaguanine synthase
MTTTPIPVVHNTVTGRSGPADRVDGRALVAILSGGLDSCVAVALAQDQGLKIKAAVLFDYGQKHVRELAAAVRIAAALEIPHIEKIELPRQPFAQSALVQDGTLEMPKGRTLDEIANSGNAPTYVPNRNAVMISLATAYAYTIGAAGVVGGWHADDTSGYPDCRPEFIQAMQAAMRLAIDDRLFTVYAPLIKLGKEAVIRAGLQHHAPIELTWSCYQGGEWPCGVCDSCRIRAAGFAAIGIPDPALQLRLPRV